MDVWEILRSRGLVQQSTDEAALRRALSTSPVTYYAGFDPTADSLHVGHLVPIVMMAHLQRAGHRPIAVVGGGTAMVGDPSGKTELRQMLSEETIRSNSLAIKRQLERFLVLDGEKGLMVDNAEWLLDLKYVPFLRDIGRLFSVNRMLAAEAYKLRLERGLSFIEFNYQILQAYDYLELYRRYGCTLQVGGDDQWGNILPGADLIRRITSKDSEGDGGVVVHCMTTPLLTTASGQKMGKTAAGALWLDPAKTPVFDFYQYFLNVDDRDVGKLLRLYTFLPIDEVERLERLEGADVREAKRVLAHQLTSLIHGEAEAERAAAATRAMVTGEASDSMATHSVRRADIVAGLKLAALVADCGLAKSRGEARRLIDNRGVTIHNVAIENPEATVQPDQIVDGGFVLRVGKKRAVRVIVED